MTADTHQAALGEAADVVVRATDLAVVLRAERHGPMLAQEPVAESDLADLFAELWRDGWLRAGMPDVPYDELEFAITAELDQGEGPKCRKLVFHARDRQGRSRSIEPGTHAFQDVATRASQALLGKQILKPEDLYFYEVALVSRPPPRQEHEAVSFSVRPQPTPLVYLKLPLGPLLKRAEAVGAVDDGRMPVLYTADAVLRAQKYAQKGAGYDPPAETGGVLVGPLCSCPDTGEMFVVVCDVLEARDAEGSSLSLLYTGKTWARIQAVMRARQSQPGTRAHRIVGQAHGHNVLPGGSCKECEKAPKCKLTSVFVSHDDRTWSQAVFARQPWQLCHIFGLSARGEAVHALYGLEENRLQQRGFYVISRFNPDGAEPRIATSD